MNTTVKEPAKKPVPKKMMLRHEELEKNDAAPIQYIRNVFRNSQTITLPANWLKTCTKCFSLCWSTR
jgi:hypothetical protein